MMMEMESDERRQHLGRQAAARILAVMKDTEAMSDTYRNDPDSQPLGIWRRGRLCSKCGGVGCNDAGTGLCEKCGGAGVLPVRQSPATRRALAGLLPTKVLA